jgi:hypothetical protein
MRESTPLRSINDDSINDITAAGLDEHFDAEFLDGLGDADMSMFDGIQAK